MRLIRIAKYLLPALFVLMMVLEAVGCALPGISGTSGPTTSSTQIPSNLINAVSSLNTTEVVLLPDFSTLIAKARPSVVAITTKFTSYMWGRPFTQEGAGSGWVIGKDGIIVTNEHVVGGAISITVALEDGRTFTAEKVSTDPDADLAIIKIDAHDLPALQVGDSSNLLVGNWVVAIGNSLGLGISATKGIVSALNVSLSGSSGEAYANLIQTDAAINPGNSGGPLLNLAGEVVGINSAKIAQIGVEGMGYAISTDEAMPVIQELIQKF